MSMNLQYNYAQVDPDTGLCVMCGTFSYEVPLSNYIPIPYATNDYMDKYYNFEDGLWYWDAEFTDLWEECPSHNI